MNFQFAHYNYNVINLEKSLRFYEEALGLKEARRKEAPDGSFILSYLTDGRTGFELELTWLRDWEADRYNLGDNEIHLYHRRHGCRPQKAWGNGLHLLRKSPNGHLLY